MGSEENKQVALEYIRRFDSGDIGHSHELLAEDLVWWVIGDLPFSGSIGKPQFRKNNESIVGYFKAFPSWIADSAIAEGDQVVVICHSSAETKGGFKYRNQYQILFRVRNGLIDRAYEYMDTKHCHDLLAAIEAEQAQKS